MKTIYLIRHATPQLQPEQAESSDIYGIPLGIYGKLQSVLLADVMQDKGVVNICCSPEFYCAQTAEIIGEPLLRSPMLSEVSCCEPEKLAEAQGRIERCILRCAATMPGDIAIVSHHNLLRLFLCKITGVDISRFDEFELPCGTVTTVRYNGAFSVSGIAEVPHPALDTQLCEKLLKAARVSGKTAARSRAVAAEALRIGEELKLDLETIRSAAYLHELAKAMPQHAATATEWLNGLGYPEIADIVRQHHDLDKIDVIDEAAVVYIAAKTVLDDQVVGISNHQAVSAGRCKTQKEKEKLRERYIAATAVKNRINSMCGKELVK